MKKLVGGGLLMMVMFGFFCIQSSFAEEKPVEDNQLIEQESEKMLKLEDLKFKQVHSCKNLETVLEKYIKNPPRNYRGWLNKELMIQNDVVMENAGVDKTENIDSGVSTKGEVDHSSTNNQKEGVDEPDSIKNDGNYVYYYNAKKHKIYIIKTPLFKGKLELSHTKVETIVNIPKSFSNIQVFINKNKLIILASRYQNTKQDYWGISNNQKTAIIVYDMTNKQKPKIDRFNDVNGYLKDARLIGDTLYVFSESAFYNPMPYYRTLAGEKTAEKIKEDINSKKFLPTLLDVRADGKLSLHRYTADCDKISYVMPDDETLEKMYLEPVFTTITALDTQNYDKKPELTVLLTPMDQIHVSKNSVYVVDYLYFPTRYSCGWGANCIMPLFDKGENTLIHKFTINNMQLDYVNSNVIAGSPLTQYSMDEDIHGYFRILTKKGWDEGTNFFSLDKNLSLLGKIENIEPKENFQASRYIGDKLYLVTYEQIDPLFVIDIADIKNPKIIGAMKTPGYSTYLHPLGKVKNGIQYLIGLGYGTKNKGENRIVNSGVKVSLYKVNYNEKESIATKCGDLEKYPKQFEECKKLVHPDYIAVSTVDEIVYGGQGSDSEVLRNPRLFVMDKNNRVTLPLFLQDRVKNGERCTTEIDENGVEIKRNCYPVEKTETNFIGLKSWDISVAGGIKEEFSVDYTKMFEKMIDSRNKYNYNPLWRAKWSNMRVGYIGEVLFMVNDYFADFVLNNQHKYLYFGEKK